MNKEFQYSSTKYSNRVYIFLSALALSLGGFIYIFLRSSEHVFFSWIHTVGLDNWLNLARHHSLTQTLYLPDWIVFSMPNGLWAFAYSLIITGIWSGSKSWLRYFWISSIPILVIGYEVLQWAEIISGIFCMQDITLGITGLILGIIVGIKTIKSNNYEKASE